MEKTTSNSPFPETRWTRILTLQSHPADDPRRQQSLNDLCSDYWKPIYAHVRRLGVDPSDAEDITQEFFGMLLSRDLFQKAQPERGRLRNFLLGSFRLFWAGHRRDQSRLKRGGGQKLLSLDAPGVELELAAHLATDQSEVAQFDQIWAATLIARARAALESEYQARGQLNLYRELLRELPAGSKGPSPGGASPTGPVNGARRIAAFRFRQRLRQLIENEVAATLETRADLPSELAHLKTILAGTDLGN